MTWQEKHCLHRQRITTAKLKNFSGGADAPKQKFSDLVDQLEEFRGFVRVSVLI